LSKSKSTILLVDDEELPLMLRKLVLEKHDYGVITATSAADAVKILKSNHVDLVLTDQLMPGGTGTDLAREIRQLRLQLPVVLLSGVNEIPHDADAADLFISKIEGPAVMCEKIAGLLKRADGGLRSDSAGCQRSRTDASTGG
jgi:CheY-like chemotaxis protein